MLDHALRRAITPPLEVAARWLARRGVRPATLTGLGLAVGVAAAIAAALGSWTLALMLWLVSRLLDGLDGPVARVLARASDRGAWADMASDVVAYAAIVVGAAIGQPDAQLAAVALLGAYYVNGSLFVLQALAVERKAASRTGSVEVSSTQDPRRVLHGQRGLIEGTETIVATALMLAFPAAMALVMGVFAGLVALTAVQRALATSRLLATHARHTGPAPGEAVSGG